MVAGAEPPSEGIEREERSGSLASQPPSGAEDGYPVHGLQVLWEQAFPTACQSSTIRRKSLVNSRDLSPLPDALGWEITPPM